MKRDVYMMECLWSMATDAKFLEYTGKKPKGKVEYPTRPTMKRYLEHIGYIEPIEDEKDEDESSPIDNLVEYAKLFLEE